MAALRARILPRLPIAFVGGPGVNITRVNGVVTIDVENGGVEFGFEEGTAAEGNDPRILAGIFSLQDPRIITGSGIITAADDDATIIINKEEPTATTINLPNVADRLKQPLEIVDVSTIDEPHEITLVAQAGETINGSAEWVINVSVRGSFLRLRPVPALSMWVLTGGG